MIEALLVSPEASGSKEKVTERALIPVGFVENSFVRNLVNSIRKRRAEGGAIVKQFAEKTKEKFKSFPVRGGLVEAMLGNSPLVSNLSSSSGSQ